MYNVLKCIHVTVYYYCIIIYTCDKEYVHNKSTIMYMNFMLILNPVLRRVIII
jgi:hypothetical protein